ncbi:hypothetical protein PV11_04698 [Exophiala sideris]|uniref:Uncharacterized protein n=1 Tax=Exophiala sideris TaxID=1016849 RepID=A0A0D1Z6W8_9EURO|nr:hypothetical protein PV11_04698 [Exophiala sideris]
MASTPQPQSPGQIHSGIVTPMQRQASLEPFLVYQVCRRFVKVWSSAHWSRNFVNSWGKGPMKVYPISVSSCLHFLRAAFLWFRMLMDCSLLGLVKLFARSARRPSCLTKPAR